MIKNKKGRTPSNQQLFAGEGVQFRFCTSKLLIIWKQKNLVV